MGRDVVWGVNSDNKIYYRQENKTLAFSKTTFPQARHIGPQPDRDGLGGGGRQPQAGRRVREGDLGGQLRGHGLLTGGGQLLINVKMFVVIKTRPVLFKCYYSNKHRVFRRISYIND